MTNSIAHENVDRNSQLQIGMTQEEVYQIMRYPSSEDQIATGSGCYDIWFYVTKANILDQSRPVSRNLTPLIFKDGIFVGMGRQYYNQLVKKIQEPQLAPVKQPPAEAAPAGKVPEPGEEREDIEFEKTLAPEKKPGSAKPKKPAPSEAKPIKPAKKSQQPLTMCSKPRRIEPSTGPDAKDQLKNDSSNQDTSRQKLDEEDRDMLDREREENFNDW